MPFPRFPRVFLSCSFDAEDRRVFGWFRRLLEALDYEVLSGEEPSTHSLPQVAQERIAAAHAFVGVFTRRTKAADADDWLPPSWVRDETAIAYSFKKPVAILAEEGVRVDGIVPQLTKFERWKREDLGDSAPTIVRYLVVLRNELSPPLEVTGDLATIRALCEDLSGIASQLGEVEETQEFSVFSWPLAVARHTGRLYTLPDDLKEKVLDAYRAADDCEAVLREVGEARRRLRSGIKGAFLLDTSPGPPLPAGHPLLGRVKKATEEARAKVGPALIALFKAGYPKEWSEVQRRVENMPEGPQKEATRAALAVLFDLGLNYPPPKN
jgi:hypothetical protein